MSIIVDSKVLQNYQLSKIIPNNITYVKAQEQINKNIHPPLQENSYPLVNANKNKISDFKNVNLPNFNNQKKLIQPCLSFKCICFAHVIKETISPNKQKTLMFLTDINRLKGRLKDFIINVFSKENINNSSNTILNSTFNSHFKINFKTNLKIDTNINIELKDIDSINYQYINNIYNWIIQISFTNPDLSINYIRQFIYTFLMPQLSIPFLVETNSSDIEQYYCHIIDSIFLQL